MAASKLTKKYPMRGTYVSGRKFDWEEAKEYVEKMRSAGREWSAAAGADPGIVSCPTCGHMHWDEYECFICARCGATVTTVVERQEKPFLPNDKNHPSYGSTYVTYDHVTTATPPTIPENVPPLIFHGIRVRFEGKDEWRRGKLVKAEGRWPAGDVPIGTCGTIVDRYHGQPGKEKDFLRWSIDFDGITPKKNPRAKEDGNDYSFGTHGPFLEDNLVPIASFEDVDTLDTKDAL